MKRICTICGNFAPSRKQWHNLDKGYGVCAKCYQEELKRAQQLFGEETGLSETILTYGHPGIHHSL